MITATRNQFHAASISIYIGRLPTANLIIDEGKYTFENVTLDASTSFDEDGGDVICRFEIEYAPQLIDSVDSEDCSIVHMWNDDGTWSDGWTSTGMVDGEVVNLSDTQRYKMCGNAVTVPVVRAIAAKILMTKENKTVILTL